MKKRGIGKIVRRSVCVLLAAYLLAAVLPYAFVPAPPAREAAQAWQSAAAGDRATILPTGEQALDARLNLIANAKSSLVVGTYLFADDESGKTIAAALLSAAERGVHVRVLTDGLVGGANLLGSDLGYAMGGHPNIELRYYNPLNLLAPWGLNARYHEKYVLADDRIFVLGGRNVSDEFLTGEDDPHYNYDMDVLLYRDSPAGDSAAAALSAYFDGLWDTLCAPQFEAVPGYRQEAVDKLRASLALRYEAICRERAEAVAPINWAALTVPIDGFALLTNPTTPSVKAPALWTRLIGLMREAEERVWIQTPYLVLNSQMRDDLAEAAALPTEFAVLTNSRAVGNNIVASADLLLQRGTLTRMDMALYEFQGDASMHTKTMLIDHDLSVFGSFNFDMRSAYIDTEVMLAVKSEEINAMLEQHMLAMRAQSLPVQDDGSYGANEGVRPAEIPWGKDLLIHIASPFILLVRFLV